MNVRALLTASLMVACGALVPVKSWAAHDSVVLPLRPKTYKFGSGVADIVTKVTVTVRNADVLPEPETPGHWMQLVASDGDCPAGTVAGLPDFNAAMPDPQDSALLKGGAKKTAKVPLHLVASAFAALNAKIPTRCTLRFSAHSVDDDSDPTPSNDVAFLTLNVRDANGADPTSGPELFLDSVVPAAITLHPPALGTKKLRVAVRNGAVAAQQATLSIDPGTCPSGLFGDIDLDTKTLDAQPSLSIPAGAKKWGAYLVTINPAAVPPGSKVSPFRCVATLSVSGADGDTDARNNRVSLSLDINGGGAVLPALVQSDPLDGVTQMARTRWMRLQFDADVDATALGAFTLRCDDTPLAFSTYLLDPTLLILNPRGSLPAGAACRLDWPGSGGPARLDFSTAAAGVPVEVLYDRDDATRTAPFPDDYWLQPDATTRTGVRLAMALPDMPSGEQDLFAALLHEANQLDGFSPIGHLTVEISDAVDPSSVPTTREASVDPLATVGLFDVDPASPTVGQRIPFELHVRDDTNDNALTSHTLLLFPSIPLTPRGRYGLVITRAALTDVTRPLEPSSFFSAALAAATPGEAAAITRTRDLATSVIDAVASYSALPIPADDVALAVRISVRSDDDFPTEMVAMRQQVRAMAAPAINITSVQSASSPLAAIVKGTWQAPEFRNGVDLARDGDGLPLLTGTKPIEFTLALPRAALNGPVPVTMYQHGSPGNPVTEVPKFARQEMAGGGFALIGFRDVLNREVSPNATSTEDAATQQVLAILQGLLNNQKIPDYWIETNAEQLGFVRAIQQLGTLDVLPVGAPDGVPDLNVSAPLTYFGISEGSIHAPALLAYEPDIRAAALTVGGARATETLIHQQAQTALNALALFYPNLTPADVWVGFGIFQCDFDRQDTHNQAPFIYRKPLTMDATTKRASILVTEGLTDSWVPNNATDSLAWSLGPLPHLQTVQRSVPFLTPVSGPVIANIDATTTAAFYQFVPAGVPGIAVTPGCEAQPEGHYCAQSAPAASAQRVAFFQTALANAAPTIINPLP